MLFNPITENCDPDAIFVQISDYYTGTISTFGATPQGVDWTCSATQELRFMQLLKLCDFTSSFTLNDLGCGYGALLGFLDRNHPHAASEYVGVDVSAEMIRAARRQWIGRDHVCFTRGHKAPKIADYSVASGIFNVKLHQNLEFWECFIAETLLDLFAQSARGFAVNFIDKTLCQPTPEGLYTTHPDKWIQFCASHFDTVIDIVGGYGLREFTLLFRY